MSVRSSKWSEAQITDETTDCAGAESNDGELALKPVVDAAPEEITCQSAAATPVSASGLPGEGSNARGHVFGQS